MNLKSIWNLKVDTIADRKISMPHEHLEKVIALSTELGFEIVINDEVLVDSKTMDILFILI